MQHDRDDGSFPRWSLACFLGGVCLPLQACSFLLSESPPNREIDATDASTTDASTTDAAALASFCQSTYDFTTAPTELVPAGGTDPTSSCTFEGPGRLDSRSLECSVLGDDAKYLIGTIPSEVSSLLIQAFVRFEETDQSGVPSFAGAMTIANEEGQAIVNVGVTESRHAPYLRDARAMQLKVDQFSVNEAAWYSLQMEIDETTGVVVSRIGGETLTMTVAPGFEIGQVQLGVTFATPTEESTIIQFDDLSVTCTE